MSAIGEWVEVLRESLAVARDPLADKDALTVVVKCRTVCVTTVGFRGATVTVRCGHRNVSAGASILGTCHGDRARCVWPDTACSDR